MEKSKIKVAYLGPEGTFTERAAREMFHDADYVPLAHIRKVVLAVENGETDFGVVPFENYHKLKVVHTLDALTQYASRAKIIMEKALSIMHCFGALANHGEIKRVFLKDQAIDQCDSYLTDNYPLADTVEVSSTGEGAARIVRENLLDAAAIASEGALRNSGLQILAKDICPNNLTNFIALGRLSTLPTGDDKTFVSIYPTRDEPGILCSCLEFPKAYKLNLEDITPRRDNLSRYCFYTELDGHERDPVVQRVIADIRFFLDRKNEFPDAVKIFGSYPNTHWRELK